MTHEQKVRGLDGNYNKGEKRYQEELKLRPMRYGFHRVPDGPKGNVLCSTCQNELNGHHTVINGQAYCASCLNALVRGKK